MAGKVIWSALRFLSGKHAGQDEDKKKAEFKARVARIEAFEKRASGKWEKYFAKGASEQADPLAKSYHVYIRTLMAELQKGRRHPEHDRAIKESATIWQNVQRLRVEAGLPRKPPSDPTTESPPSAELAAALAALEKAKVETKRTSCLPLPEATTEDLKSILYEDRCRFGWAARVMPIAEFEDRFLDFWRRFGPAHGKVGAMRTVVDDLRPLLRFPRLELALERWPDLPFSYDPPTQEELLRAEWKKSEPLVSDSDPIEKIEAIFADFTADDLHDVAHGESTSSAPFILTIARHPLCDWASALEILHSFSADAYQTYWSQGKSESDFDDENERMLFEAFEIIARRANGVGFRSRSFKTNFGNWSVTSGGKPNPYHPQNWQKWAIPEKNLHRPEGLAHKPAIDFQGNMLRPSFEAWLKARG